MKRNIDFDEKSSQAKRKIWKEKKKLFEKKKSKKIFRFIFFYNRVKPLYFYNLQKKSWGFLEIVKYKESL